MISSMGLEKLGFTSADYILQDDGKGWFIREWFSDKPRPTTADIEIAHAEWQAEYDAQAYARKRVAAYDAAGCTIEECVHAILDDGLIALQEKREAIKAKYPKVSS